MNCIACLTAVLSDDVLGEWHQSRQAQMKEDRPGLHVHVVGGMAQKQQQRWLGSARDVEFDWMCGSVLIRFGPPALTSFVGQTTDYHSRAFDIGGHEACREAQIRRGRPEVVRQARKDEGSDIYSL